MQVKTTERAYQAVRDMVTEQFDGTMEWQPGQGSGVGGGVWHIEVSRIGSVDIAIHDDIPNKLDHMYETNPGVDVPNCWNDYSDTLKRGHAAQLVLMLA